MNLFERFKKDKLNTEKTSDNQKSVSLEKAVSLRKDIILDETKKQGIKNTKARVVFTLDHSGSMNNEYNNGYIQMLLERIFPMAMCFDDNEELEFFLFDDKYKELKSVTMRNLKDYVRKRILTANIPYGGTNYAPIINAITDKYAHKNPSKIPTFVIFITDGDNFDTNEATNALINASKYNIFWKFIGIGYSSFTFLKELDNMPNRTVDNANFVSINDIHDIPDRELYEKLLTEYSDWQNAYSEIG